MSEIKLLNCPFCGGEAELNRTIFKGREMYSVSCKHKFDCTIGTTFLRESKEEAIKLWNTRKPMERIIERLEEYKQSEVNFKEIIDTKIEIANPTVSRTIGRIEAFDRMIEVVKEEGGIK